MGTQVCQALTILRHPMKTTGMNRATQENVTQNTPSSRKTLRFPGKAEKSQDDHKLNLLSGHETSPGVSDSERVRQQLRPVLSGQCGPHTPCLCLLACLLAVSLYRPGRPPTEILPPLPELKTCATTIRHIIPFKGMFSVVSSVAMSASDPQHGKAGLCRVEARPPLWL